MNDIALCEAKFPEVEGEDRNPVFGHVEKIEVEIMESENITDDCLEEWFIIPLVGSSSSANKAQPAILFLYAVLLSAV